MQRLRRREQPRGRRRGRERFGRQLRRRFGRRLLPHRGLLRFLAQERRFLRLGAQERRFLRLGAHERRLRLGAQRRLLGLALRPIKRYLSFCLHDSRFQSFAPCRTVSTADSPQHFFLNSRKKFK
uniref:Uncharacterized protein n=1 Tax=Ceratitis capitata TaxID=7213 RepID=W8BZC5_CERCA